MLPPVNLAVEAQMIQWASGVHLSQTKCIGKVAGDVREVVYGVSHFCN